MSNLLEKMNEQMNREYESAYVYKALAAYCAENDYNGSERWMNEQAKEEIFHAEKFRNFLHDLDHEVKFTGMEPVEENIGSLLDAFKASLEHEKYITRNIKEIYKQAVEESNYEVQIFLNWFIMEQVEEEASVGEVVSKLEKIGDSTSGLFMYDAVLGRRDD
ncbi:MAG: ferritin [Tissierellia bacterium]|nr:ferritin [Tissierellia bacterium]